MRLYRSATYREVLNDLVKASDWFSSKGIKKRRKRLDAMLANINLIATHYENGTTDKLKDLINTVEAYYSMTDAFAIIEIHQSFSQLKDHQLPRYKLNAILDGPIVPYEEDASRSTNAPRNYLFELQIAALFLRKGIPVTKYNDVSFDFEDKHYCIECKRLTSHKSVENELLEAISQMSQFTLSSDKNRGMIALSIEKLYGVDRHFLNTSSLKQMDSATIPIIERFRKYYGKTWFDVLNMRFVCVLISLSCVATMDEAGMTSYVTQLVAFDRFPDFKGYISSDQAQLRRLFEILNLQQRQV